MDATVSVIDSAIDGLQRACEATRVPGELATWLKRMQESLATVRVVLSGESLPQHRKDFKEISKDNSLIPKVEQLRVEDTDLLASVRHAEALAELAAKKLDASKGQEEDVVVLTELGTITHSIVIRLRAQEQAISTWFLEAINRDEGVSG